VPRGGFRPGSGRPKGSKTRSIRDRRAAEGNLLQVTRVDYADRSDARVKLVELT
jgi:hypothetical protein